MHTGNCMHTTTQNGVHIMYNNSKGDRQLDKATVRSQDLSTRERVNFVVDSSLMQQLRERSAIQKVPMSRMIDSALHAYLNSSGNDLQSFRGDIILYHTLEIIVAALVESETCLLIFANIAEYFTNFIYTSCLINQTDTPTLGTKIYLFVNDCETDKFSGLISYLTSSKDSEKINIILDQKPI